MKIKIIALALITSLCLGFTTASVSAYGSEEHAPKKSVGPNGGRVLHGTDPRAEFFITSERKVKITFLDDQGQPITPAGQKVVVTSGQRSAPTQLNFSQVGDVLVSDVAVPEGRRVPTVVQITSPDGLTAIERLNVNLAVCSGCDNPEYACICVGH